MTTTTTPPDRAGEDAPRTQLPTLDLDAPPAVPRASLGKPTADERFVRWGAWVGALGLAWVLTQRVFPMAGLPWFLVVWFVCGLIITIVFGIMDGGSVEAKDKVAGSVITAGAMLVGAALISTVAYIFYRGWEPLTHLNFFIEDSATAGPRDPLTEGGILHAIVGTLIELTIAVAITLPLGVGTAVFMTEVGGRFARIVRTVVEAMTALPSIVAGLFIYTTWIVALGNGRSGLAAGFAIAVMMLPIIARASDVVLRVVPGGLREASLALGASRWRTVWHVVLPTARPGLATALILGIARGAGETSPVLLTSGAATFLVINPTDGPMNSLPLYIYTAVRSGQGLDEQRGFAAAAVLLVIVLTLFVIARLLARPRSTKAKGRSSRSTTRSGGAPPVPAPPVDNVRADPMVEAGPVPPDLDDPDNLSIPPSSEGPRP